MLKTFLITFSLGSFIGLLSYGFFTHIGHDEHDETALSSLEEFLSLYANPASLCPLNLKFSSEQKPDQLRCQDNNDRVTAEDSIKLLRRMTSRLRTIKGARPDRIRAQIALEKNRLQNLISDFEAGEVFFESITQESVLSKLHCTQEPFTFLCETPEEVTRRIEVQKAREEFLLLNRAYLKEGEFQNSEGAIIQFALSQEILAKTEQFFSLISPNRDSEFQTIKDYYKEFGLELSISPHDEKYQELLDLLRSQINSEDSVFKDFVVTDIRINELDEQTYLQIRNYGQLEALLFIPAGQVKNLASHVRSQGIPRVLFRQAAEALETFQNTPIEIDDSLFSENSRSLGQVFAGKITKASLGRLKAIADLREELLKFANERSTKLIIELGKKKASKNLVHISEVFDGLAIHFQSQAFLDRENLKAWIEDQFQQVRKEVPETLLGPLEALTADGQSI